MLNHRTKKTKMTWHESRNVLNEGSKANSVMDKRIRRSVVIPSEQKFQPGSLIRKMSTLRDGSLEERDKLEKVSSQTILQQPLTRPRQSTFYHKKSPAWNSDKHIEKYSAPKTHFHLHRNVPMLQNNLLSNQSSRSPSADP